MTHIPLGTMFARAVERDPETLAVVDGPVRMTYAVWDRHVRGLAAGLAGLGVRDGDAVVVFLSNRSETASLFWACQMIGARFVPFNWRGSSEDFAYVLADAEARAVVYEPRSETGARPAAERSDIAVERRVLVGGAAGDGTAFAELAAAAPVSGPAPVDPGRTCLMLYTSGTTGRPKGVPRSHDAERHASIACAAQLRYGYRERQLGVMPLFHTMGARALEMAAVLSGAYVCMPAFDAGAALRLIETERIGALFLVPTMFHDMVRHPDRAASDLSSVRRIGYAGASMTTALTRACREVFAPETFVNFYGSSEIYTLATCDHVVDKPGCAGRAGIGQCLRVVHADPDGRSGPDRVLPRGEIGEVVAPMDGPDAFEGYWKRPDADARAIRGGWYFTGDLGYFDADGELFLVGRVDDMIVSGGENIHPEEVEDLLDGLDQVRQAAVVGISDDRLGHKVVAFVEPASEAATAEALDAACLASDLARFKRPRAYVFVESIPRSASGKLLRRFLRDGAYQALPDHESTL